MTKTVFLHTYYGLPGPGSCLLYNKLNQNDNTSKSAYKKELLKVREDGIALDREEYIKEIVAIAVPLSRIRKDLQAAIWVAGLKHQVTEDLLPGFKELMKEIAMEINHRFSKTA